MDSHLLRFLEDALQTVNKIFVVVITLVNVENGQNMFVFIVNQFSEHVDIVGVSKVIPC